MNAAQAIYKLLSESAAVAAIVSTRIYPLAAPQSFVAPYITYQLVDNYPSNTKSGSSITDEVMYQINFVGLDHDQAYDLKEKARTALDYQSAPGIQHISFQGERGLWDDNAQLQGAFAFSADYMIREIRQNGLPALEIEFDNIANAPVTDPASFSDWNTFYISDIEMGGNAFDSAKTVGNTAYIYNGSKIVSKHSIFYFSTALKKFIDNAMSTTVIGDDAFRNVTNLTEFKANAAITIGDGGLSQCPVLDTVEMKNLVTAGVNSMSYLASNRVFSFPKLETVGTECFAFSGSMETLYIPSMLNLGPTTGYDGVFAGTGGKIITVTVPIALQTCNGGEMDGDLQYLADNNTVTFNWV